MFIELWSPRSGRQKGTLFSLRNFLGMTSVNADVKHSFAYASDFMSVVTRAYVVLAAKEIMSTKPVTKVDAEYLKDIAKEVVDICFLEPVLHNTDKPVSTAPYPYCVCNEEIGGVMRRCDNKLCKGGKWFHPRCLGLLLEAATPYLT